MTATIYSIAYAQNSKTKTFYQEISASGKPAGKNIDVTLISFDACHMLAIGDTIDITVRTIKDGQVITL